MGTNIEQFLQFISAVIILAWIMVGAHQWLRYGSVGVHFQFSKEYERACSDWQRHRLDEKEADSYILPIEDRFTKERSVR